MLWHSPRNASQSSCCCTLGAAWHVPYSRAGDPGGAAPGEDALKIRPLVIDGNIKEWTTGRSPRCDRPQLRGAARDAAQRHAPRRGPARKVRPCAKRPLGMAARSVAAGGPGYRPHWRPEASDYNPGVSQVTWFRDYAAYCGLTSSGKNLYALVAQIAARKPVLAKKLVPFDTAGPGGASLQPGRMATRTVASHVPPSRRGRREFRHCARIRGPGRRLSG